MRPVRTGAGRRDPAGGSARCSRPGTPRSARGRALPGVIRGRGAEVRSSAGRRALNQPSYASGVRHAGLQSWTLPAATGASQKMIASERLHLSRSHTPSGGPVRTRRCGPGRYRSTMPDSVANPLSNWTSSLVEGLLGRRPAFTGWLILGGIAALSVVAQTWTARPGLLTFAGVLDFFRLPDGAGDFFRGMHQWAAASFATNAGSSALFVVVIACAASIAYSSANMRPAMLQSPSPTTLWIAILFLQSASFTDWWGLASAYALIGIIVGLVCLGFAVQSITDFKSYFHVPLVMLVIEPVVVLFYATVCLLAPMFITIRRGSSISPPI
jgi:hypothetical protein